MLSLWSSTHSVEATLRAISKISPIPILESGLYQIMLCFDGNCVAEFGQAYEHVMKPYQCRRRQREGNRCHCHANVEMRRKDSYLRNDEGCLWMVRRDLDVLDR